MTEKQHQHKNDDIMKILTENIDKLNILLSGSKNDKPMKYSFKGKRSTKTVFMSIKLQYLINEYCIETDAKIGDVIETAMVEYLLRHNYQEKLKQIMYTDIAEGERGESEN